jgi:dolichol-phosphate mannosyltransferase
LSSPTPTDTPGLIPAPTGPFVVPPARAALDLSLVLPTFKEAGNIQAMLRALLELLEPAGFSFEILVVDDNSPDGTWEKAQEISREEPRVRVIRREEERGLSSAVIRGWQVARGEILGVMDADLQHPPEILLEMRNRLRENAADLIVASRHQPGGGVSDWALSRRVISRGAQALGLAILPEVISRVSDPMSGCFLMRRAGITGIPLQPTGYKILLEILARGRFPTVHEAPYVFRERTDGESKLTRQVYLDYLRQLISLRLRRSNPA